VKISAGISGNPVEIRTTCDSGFFHYNIVLKATGWTTEVRFPIGSGIFISSFGSHPVSFHWAPAPLSPAMKRPGHETDHSSLSGSEFNNAWSYISTPP
jgi:hypothetical protein